MHGNITKIVKIQGNAAKNGGEGYIPTNIGMAAAIPPATSLSTGNNRYSGKNGQGFLFHYSGCFHYSGLTRRNYRKHFLSTTILHS